MKKLLLTLLFLLPLATHAQTVEQQRVSLLRKVIALQAHIQKPLVFGGISPTTDIVSEIVGKTSIQKADIKSQSITQLSPVGVSENTLYGVIVEIQKVEKINGGVQVFARAWKGGKPLGFGSDGTVEIERFRIYNPPILVDDINGTIVRAYTEKGVAKSYKLREDPLQAIKDVLASTVSTVGKTGTKIVTGKVGNTTDVFFPAAGEVSPVDGAIFRDGVAEIFSSIVTGVGVRFQDTDTLGTTMELNGKFGQTDKFESDIRSIWGFDTSTIGSDTISAATFSFIANGKFNSLGSPDVYIVPAAPASASVLAASDFQNGFTRTDLGHVTYASVTADNATYNDVTLNATGISTINKTGNTFLGGMQSWDFNQSFTGTWASNVESGFQLRFADQTGTTLDPKLTVVHAAAAGGGGSVPQELLIFD